MWLDVAYSVLFFKADPPRIGMNVKFKKNYRPLTSTSNSHTRLLPYLPIFQCTYALPNRFRTIARRHKSTIVPVSSAELCISDVHNNSAKREVSLGMGSTDL